MMVSASGAGSLVFVSFILGSAVDGATRITHANRDSVAETTVS